MLFPLCMNHLGIKLCLVYLCYCLSVPLCLVFITRRAAEGVYKFKEVWAERKVNKDWNRILQAHFFQGLREGTFILSYPSWYLLRREVN